MNSGTGPGTITPDGSPVEFYTLLPPGEAATPPNGTVLELGSGVGRVTHHLDGFLTEDRTWARAVPA
ncbi:hypothetical protein [Nonomuraea recticatena]|uniref:SAM-dependent methyltransferase n=1 Tax=Nonomuraea recticatena TaxID=46178 RepID=A0ABN3S9X4_9ACTN